MGSLFERITDWIKEGLIEAITGQYTGIFESVNNQVSDVASQVGQTPQGWNGGVFSMIQNLSETVVMGVQFSRCGGELLHFPVDKPALRC